MEFLRVTLIIKSCSKPLAWTDTIYFHFLLMRMCCLIVLLLALLTILHFKCLLFVLYALVFALLPYIGLSKGVFKGVLWVLETP